MKAKVDLWPEKNAYQIAGTYTIQNKTQQPIQQILVNFDADFKRENVAMYTELMLVRQMHGAKRVLENVRPHSDLYFNQRGVDQEQPLYRTHPENAHQHYSKGWVGMHQLSEMLGEKAVNTALKNLLQKHGFPHPAPVSTDLLDELYAVSPIGMHSKIDDLFKRVTTYSVRLDQIQAKKSGSDYGVAVRGSVGKFYENGKGLQTRSECNDWLEIEIEFAGGTSTLKKISVEKNRFELRFASAKKPLPLTIDPNEKWLRMPEQQEYEF